MIRDRLADVPIEATISSVATKGGMGGGTAYAVYGWITSSSAAVVIGIIVTVLGFAVNIIYQRKRDAREEKEKEFNRDLMLREEKRKDELHQARLRSINLQCEVVNEDTD